MKIRYAVFITLLMLSQLSFAGDSEERIYLVQALNQIQSIKPLLISAAREQPKTNRIKFHYTSFKGIDGREHNGVIEDIAEIEKGIKEKLHSISSEPHVFNPIKGDYFEHRNSENK